MKKINVVQFHNYGSSAEISFEEEFSVLNVSELPEDVCKSIVHLHP